MQDTNIKKANILELLYLRTLHTSIKICVYSTHILPHISANIL